jgi:phytanoyl-CoA hydroxylase
MTSAVAKLLHRVKRRALRELRAVRPRFAAPPATPEERRRAWERDGFVAGGALLDEGQVARLRDEFDRIFAGRNGLADVEHDRLTDGAGREYFKVYDLHRVSPAFEAVARHPRLVAMLAELTGGDAFRVLIDQLHYKPPRAGGWNGWHRDMPSFPLVRPCTALTAWVALDDATERSGCMLMVPGSHQWGDAADIAGDGWSLPGVDELRAYHGHPVRAVPRPVRSGHVHFHHELLWHCSGANLSRGKRRALAIHYIGADDRYREGGRTAYAGLATGASLHGVAPLVVTSRRG